MYAFKIRGGKVLRGTTEIKGAKNATLPLLICALLTKETVIIHNVSQLSDIKVLIDLLRGLVLILKLMVIRFVCRVPMLQVRTLLMNY